MTAREAALAAALRERAQAAHSWDPARGDRHDALSIDKCPNRACIEAVRLLAESPTVVHPDCPVCDPPEPPQPAYLDRLRMEGVTDAEWEAFETADDPGWPGTANAHPGRSCAEYASDQADMPFCEFREAAP